jgi:methionyl aminopeptidase
MVSRRSPEELNRMRVAGQIVASVLEQLSAMVKPGVTTAELDRAADDIIRQAGGIPSFKGYHGYPASVCTSINEEIVHGIPGARVLREGDIVSIDAGAIWEGYHGDAAVTVAVGRVSEPVAALMAATRASLDAGIAAVKDGARLGDVSHAIERAARDAGCEVIREYGGHGIGREMHEPPSIRNWGPPGGGLRLREGMTFCLEPMLTLEGYATRVLTDGWTVVTADGSPSAHYEHTVAVTEHGAEILTLRPGDEPLEATR